MNKKILTIVLFLSSLTFSKKLPVNFEVNVGTGFDQIKINKSDIKNAGFEDLIKKDIVNYKMVVNIGTELIVPIQLPKNYIIKPGLGVSFSGNFKLLKDIFVKKDSKVEEMLSTLEVARKELEDSKEDLANLTEQLENVKNAYNVANNKFVYNKLLKRDAVKKSSSIDKYIAKVNELKAEYPQEKVDELKKEFVEKEKEADAARDKENAADGKIQLGKFAISSLETQISQTKDEEKKKQYQKDKEDIERNIEAQEKIKEQAHSDYIAALRRRKEILDITDYADKADEQIARKTKEKEEVEASIEDYNEKYNYYYDEKNKLKSAKKRILSSKLDSENKYSEKQGTFEDMKSKLESSGIDQNYRAKEAFENSFNSHKTYFSGSIYTNLEVEKQLEKISVLFGTKLGVKFTQNPLYLVSNDLDQKVEINGKTYVKPEATKKVLINPTFKIFGGLKYKGLKFEVATGYNSYLVGIDLGYEF